jgi:hypothetical protein
MSEVGDLKARGIGERRKDVSEPDQGLPTRPQHKIDPLGLVSRFHFGHPYHRAASGDQAIAGQVLAAAQVAQSLYRPADPLRTHVLSEVRDRA